jgi:hypothetical protein
VAAPPFSGTSRGAVVPLPACGLVLLGVPDAPAPVVVPAPPLVMPELLGMPPPLGPLFGALFGPWPDFGAPELSYCVGVWFCADAMPPLISSAAAARDNPSFVMVFPSCCGCP